MNNQEHFYLRPFVPTFCLAALMALVACASPRTSSSSSEGSTSSGTSASSSSSAFSGMTNEAVMKMASEGAAIWNSHNLQEISKRYAGNATFSSPIMPGPVSTQAMLESLQGLFAAVPDIKVTVVSAVPAGTDMVAEQWVVTGTWTGPFTRGPLAGIPPTGKSFTFPGASFLRVQDGKIVSESQYYDQLIYLAQLGVLQRQ